MTDWDNDATNCMIRHDLRCYCCCRFSFFFFLLYSLSFPFFFLFFSPLFPFSFFHYIALPTLSKGKASHSERASSLASVLFVHLFRMEDDRSMMMVVRLVMVQAGTEYLLEYTFSSWNTVIGF